MDLIVAPSDEENEDGIDDLMEALDLELHESKMAETDQKKETQSKESVKEKTIEFPIEEIPKLKPEEKQLETILE